jgi:DNA-binding MarR family transcriptional regulator
MITRRIPREKPLGSASSPLTASDIRAIRAAYAKRGPRRMQRELAEQFNVTQPAIHKVVTRQVYPNLD